MQGAQFFGNIILYRRLDKITWKLNYTFECYKEVGG